MTLAKGTLALRSQVPRSGRATTLPATAAGTSMKAAQSAHNPLSKGGPGKSGPGKSGPGK